MNSKILQIIHIPGLLAVIGDEEGFYTVKVSHVRLMDTGEEVPVIPHFTGKLTMVNDVPDFIGLAESESRAQGVWIRSLSEEDYKIYKQKNLEESQQKWSFDWGGCARPAVENIPQCKN